MNSTQVATPCIPPKLLPSAIMIRWCSRGSSVASSAAVASPRAASARAADSSTSLSHAPASLATPPCSSNFVYLRRCRTAISSVHDACTMGIKSAATTNMVRRHAKHAYQRPVLIQCALDCLRGRPPQCPCLNREENRRGVRAVQADQVPGDIRGCRGPRRWARWCRTARRACRSTAPIRRIALIHAGSHPPGPQPVFRHRRPGGTIPAIPPGTTVLRVPAVVGLGVSQVRQPSALSGTSVACCAGRLSAPPSTQVGVPRIACAIAPAIRGADADGPLMPTASDRPVRVAAPQRISTSPG